MTSNRPQKLEGKEAVDFAERHLKKRQTNSQTWEIEYEDASTGERWVMDYPHSEAHGAGSPRLQRRSS